MRNDWIIQALSNLIKSEKKSLKLEFLNFQHFLNKYRKHFSSSENFHHWRFKIIVEVQIKRLSFYLIITNSLYFSLGNYFPSQTLRFQFRLRKGEKFHQIYWWANKMNFHKIWEMFACRSMEWVEHIYRWQKWNFSQLNFSPSTNQIFIISLIRVCH